jgi:hypothetical protein
MWKNSSRENCEPDSERKTRNCRVENDATEFNCSEEVAYTNRKEHNFADFRDHPLPKARNEVKLQSVHPHIRAMLT